MSSIDWSKVAIEYGPSIRSMSRGVSKVSKFGFITLLVPIGEWCRIEGELANEFFCRCTGTRLDARS